MQQKSINSSDNHAVNTSVNCEPLSASKIQSFLSSESLALIDAVDVKQSVNSTNNELLALPINAARARVCMTEAQCAGRGRRGNDWQSAPNKNVMLSLSWGFEKWPETITGLGLAVALVTVEALNVDYDLDVKIKWPNDIMVDNKKLGGILIDMAGDSKGGCNVVIGLGLNVHQPDWSFDNADYQWQDLAGLQVYPDRNVLIARFIDSWLSMLDEFNQSGFSTMVQRWNKLSSYADKQIRIANTNADSPAPVVGKMLGVNADGSLVIEDRAGQAHIISDSNVSVRLV